MVVLIGVPDVKIGNHEQIDWKTNKIGGKPNWMEEEIETKCRKCGGRKIMAVQIYSPIKSEHRTIYVFVCVLKQCWSTSEGWSVYSTSKKQEYVKQEKKEVWTSSNDWGDFPDDDWGETPSSDIVEKLPDEVNLPSNAHTKNEKKSPEIETKTQSADDDDFESYYLNVFEESDLIEEQKENDHVEHLIEQYKTNLQFEDSEDKSAVVQEKYEKQENSNLRKFLKNVNKCQEQIIRYNFGGTPLRMTDVDLTVPPCGQCASELKFEFQLMPGLIPFLKSKQDEVEFGWVEVYVCGNGCSRQRQEFVAYFPDPDLKFFKTQKI